MPEPAPRPAPPAGIDPAGVPHLGLDLDGTIDERPDFFATLSHVWPGPVTVITYRRDRAKAVADLARLGVRYDGLELVSAIDAKPAVVERLGITVYADDQDEMTAGMPEGVLVLKVRNGGNFDFDTRRWLYSDQTGERV